MTWAVAAILSVTAAGSVTAGEFPDSWFFYPEDHPTRQKIDQLVGQRAPELSNLRNWVNGRPNGIDGNIVVLDFWATWCGPCIRAIPHTNEVARQYADKGVVVVGVCTSSGQEKMQQVAEQNNMLYPTAQDPNNEAAKRYGVQFYPTYVVIDRDRKVRAIGLTPNGVDKVIDKLLEEEEQSANQEKTDSSQDNSEQTRIPREWLEDRPNGREQIDALQGKAPPELNLTNWMNSDGLSAEALDGKVVVLDFWATWCGPCIAAIPHANELAEKYGDEGLVFIGVCHPRGAENMGRVVQEKGIKYPVAVDADGRVNQAYRVNSYPDYYLIDRAGKLRIADLKNNKLEEAIKLLLAEPVPQNVSESR